MVRMEPCVHIIWRLSSCTANLSGGQTLTEHLFHVPGYLDGSKDTEPEAADTEELQASEEALDDEHFQTVRGPSPRGSSASQVAKVVPDPITYETVDSKSSPEPTGTSGTLRGP
ncbi:hypothetical protein TREES_T100013970 [Tupaia chinensis]|uniref:Uncharacterized protein n=1 Tax=Tupaia chinensis TaxID=246437 RepID=L9KWM3_TUPCH|nr:hypothetical protein TREES_T100013970 [Tupaia chinensis]